MAAVKQKGLGRGLGALIDDFSVQEEQGAISTLPLQKIEPNPNQPRKQFDEEHLETLAESIREHGLLQPLAVRDMGGYYQIIAGERRWRACRLAELSEVPVVIIEADDKKVMELAMVENLQRQDLNPMEEAEGYYSLIHDFDLSQEQVAERVGKSRPAVANALRLLNLKGELRDMVTEGKLSAGHARALLSLPNEKLQKSAAQKVIALELSVRQTESMCKKMLSDLKAEEEKPAPLTVDYVGECEKLLTKQLGRKVKIINGKRKGRFELEFYGQDDLQVLYETLLALRSPEK